jgi:hypothetical protein
VILLEFKSPPMTPTRFPNGYKKVKEIEVIVRKEIRNFMDNNTIKQFEDKLMDKIQKEIRRGKFEGDIKDIALRMFREFYQFMWMNRSYWEPRLKNA